MRLNSERKKIIKCTDARNGTEQNMGLSTNAIFTSTNGGINKVLGEMILKIAL